MAKYARLNTLYICTIYESLTVDNILLGYEIKVTLNIISITFQIHESCIYFELIVKNPMNYHF